MTLGRGSGLMAMIDPKAPLAPHIRSTSGHKITTRQAGRRVCTSSIIHQPMTSCHINAQAPGRLDTTRRGVVRVRRTILADGTCPQDGARRTTARRPTSRSRARNDSASRQPNGLRMRCSSRALAPPERQYGAARSSATTTTLRVSRRMFTIISAVWQFDP